MLNVTDNKEFYAYDYLLHRWYFLGRLNEKWDARLFNESEQSDSDKTAMIETVALDGLLFTSKNVDYSVEDIPKFWSKDYNEWN